MALTAVERSRKYRIKHRDRVLAAGRDYYHKNKAKRKAEHKKWASRNRDKINARMREYNHEYLPKYRTRNRQRLREYKRRYESAKRKTNPEYRLLSTLRTQLNAVVRLRNTIKYASTKDLVGCDLGTLVKHIQSRFLDGMCWENYGRSGWHIDHITPCAVFDISNPEQQKQCFHYTNLQPLWAKDNLSKPKFKP